VSERIPDGEPVYTIAVASRLTGMHPQTLRKYERAGLLRPAREGNQRFYSASDLDRLRRIRYLVEERGLNMAGVEMTLSMTDRLDTIDGKMSVGQLHDTVADAIRQTTNEGRRPKSTAKRRATPTAEKEPG
jgi:MerR family transcriptional regulator/heat shock protein HspR